MQINSYHSEEQDEQFKKSFQDPVSIKQQSLANVTGMYQSGFSVFSLHIYNFDPILLCILSLKECFICKNNASKKTNH
jgi:hypothetical protein